MFRFPKLYKKKQVWECIVTDCGDTAKIDVYFGQDGGKIQCKTTVIDEGKNIGKSNETTVYEQALLEAKSKWNKQKDKLYSEIKSSKLEFRPMLAKSFDDHKNKVVYPCFVQPKLDGLRLNASFDGLYSRNGKPYQSLGYLKSKVDEVLSLFGNPDNIILDGELYSHSSDFQHIISAVKRDKENEFTQDIEYWIYDAYFKDEPDMPFSSRIEIINESLSKKVDNIVLVPSYVAKTEDDIDTLYNSFVKFGFEGGIVRNSDGIYLPDKRSENLLKVKSFLDAEFEIVSHEIDKNGHAVFYCKTEQQAIFKVKPSGKDKLRKEYAKNAVECYGKMMTVQFFDWTDSVRPVPRFPVGLYIRDFE